MGIRRDVPAAGLLACMLAIGCSPRPEAPPPADLLLLNGNIITVDAQDTIVQALAVKDGRIVAVGASDTIARRAGPGTRTIDLQGRTVTPGLIDTHNHFAWGAADEYFRLDLVYPAVKSIADIVELVRDEALEKNPGDWILGVGWDQGKLAEGRNLRASDLDGVSPRNPVWLGHTSGHYGVANSAALSLANIDRQTPDPAGGVIERDDEGVPTGILADNAQELMSAVAPAYSAAELAQAAMAIAPQLSAEGITTIKDPEVRDEFWEAYAQAVREGRLPLRVFALWRAPDTLRGARQLVEKIAATRATGNPQRDDLLVSGGVKIYVDGSGTVRTAWMYDDWNRDFSGLDEGNRGFPVVDPGVLEDQVRLFHEAGIHLGLHAIGDRAIDWTVDTLATVLAETPTAGLRHSIIHCNIPTDRALDVMARLQRDFDAAYPETQPGFTWWIADAYAANFGPRRNARMVPLKSYLDRGIRWGASSDYNVTPFAPRYGIWSSVAREALVGTWGKHPFGTAEAVGVRDALRAYTRWNARQVFMEDRIGSLEVGKYADLVVWDRDLYSVPTAQLKDMRAELTLLGGRTVFDRSARTSP